ncbi:MAG: hypothetical protein AAF586_04045 [Planctomycetota bacterium]
MSTPTLRLINDVNDQPAHLRVRHGLQNLIEGMRRLEHGLDRTADILERQSALLASVRAAAA